MYHIQLWLAVAVMELVSNGLNPNEELNEEESNLYRDKQLVTQEDETSWAEKCLP